MTRNWTKNQFVRILGTMEKQISERVLITLFEFRRDGQRCDAGTVAAHLGDRPSRVAATMVRLEGRGLVDASRARLTFTGLAVAVGLRPAASAAAAA